MANEKPKSDEKREGPAAYIPPPKSLPGFPNAYPVKKKTGIGGKKKRKRWVDPDSGHILEWDYQHGKVERYTDNGKHLGEFDPDSGEQTKVPKKDRTITPTIATRLKKGKMVFYLTWYKRDGDDFLGECLLPNVTEEEVRRIFTLEPDEPPGDCIEVEKEQIPWLHETAKGVSVRLDLFEYSVEARQANKPIGWKTAITGQ